MIIDDATGARLATAEAQRLQRLHGLGRPVGSLQLIGTHAILERAAGGTHLPDRATMREVYTRLRTRDDGLPPIEHTQLLARHLWQRPGKPT